MKTKPNKDTREALHNCEKALTFQRQATERKMSVAMMAAYHMSKGLAELLGMVNQTPMGFLERERVAIQEAHEHAFAVFHALNSIIEDYGNQPSRDIVRPGTPEKPE